MSSPVTEFMTQVPHSVGHDMNLETAKDMMLKYSCHHLPVLDGGHLVGVLSDTDIRVAEKYKSNHDLRVEDIMTDEPVVVEPTTDVFQVAMLMHQKKIGSVIVSATPDSPWGIFTATDALHYFTQKGENS
jgi:acetoin utilization protein AcuB